MLTPRRLIVACCLAVALLNGGCARTVASRFDPSGFDQLPTVVRVAVRVTNDSPELVHLYFITDSGRKVRIGTISPHSEVALSAFLNRIGGGRFYAHRLSNDAGTPLNGEVDPYFLTDRVVLVRIGANAVFDSWQIRTVTQR